MNRIIRHKFVFAHPIADVWEHLTNPKLLKLWLMDNDFQPIVGHKFTFRTKPKIKIGFDGVIYGEVLELSPPSRLVYSWKGGLSEGKPSLDSTVIWTLRTIPMGTELTLEHGGFKGFRNFIPYLIMNKGWEKIGNRLLKLMSERVTSRGQDA